jgi:ATP-dependent DNA helicase DinG
MLDSFVVCDLETTGLSPQQHEIIEIGMVRVENREITASFHSLVRPEQKLPVNIRRLTGLDDSQLKTSPGLPEVLPPALAFLHDYPLVGHNVAFDKSFLEAAAGPLKNPVYDTLELSRILLPDSPGYRLGVLCRFLGIENQNEHRSLSDVLATVELYRSLVSAVAKLDAQVLLQLNSFLQRANSSWAAPLALMIRQVAGQNMNAKITGPVFFSFPARNVAESFSPGRQQQETGFSEPFPESSELPSLLAAGGMLATRLESYEYRPQQQKMVCAVSRALEEQKYLLMEAGTGTGKSMAYLIPVLHWAIKNDQRVVISTRTINLQEQLWEKDVPTLLGVLSWPCKAALVKGRQNYLCLRRWLNTLTAGNWTPEEASFYARVLVWATGTATGDKAELNLNMSEQDSWVQICADSEGCLGARCRWFKGACYVTRAHRAAEAAKLIITNHSLLLSDVRVENKVLPAYGPLVIDEAHHLEDAATEQLGRQVTWSAVRRWLGAVNRLLTRLGALVPPDDVVLWQRTIKKAQDIRQQAAQAADIFFNALCALVIARADAGNQEMDRWTLRLRPTAKEREAPFLEAEYANLKLGWASLSEYLHRLVNMLEEWSSASESWGGFYSEVDQQFSTGSGLGVDLGFILACGEDNYVYWIDATRGNDTGSCSLHAVPVQIGEILYEQLFQQKDTIVLTSATLTVEGSFQHFMERTGLDLVSQDGLLQLQVDSPFSYERQSLLCVVRDVPLQNEVSEEEYLEALLATLSDLIRTVQGKTLVLFTSHRVLKETYRRLKGICEEADIYLLAHNINGSRSRLVEEFRNNERAVLLGASSFWEGIDIPGEALSCVVIVKLPFWAPSIPVIEARIEELTRQGKDGFRHFSLPQAVIRFKQGFGRLIRTMRDRGVVVVLDHRIVNKQYGRRFLNSLPIRSHIRGDTAMVNKRIAQWLQDSF